MYLSIGIFLREAIVCFAYEVFRSNMSTRLVGIYEGKRSQCHLLGAIKDNKSAAKKYSVPTDHFQSYSESS